MLARRIVALFVLLCASAVNGQGTVIMEPSINVFSSDYWTQDQFRVSNLDMVTATFVLKHDPTLSAKFESDLLARSLPSSPIYTHWLTRDQVVAKIAPAIQQVLVVTQFLNSYGLTSANYQISKFRDIIQATIPALTAEAMFQTQFARFRSEGQRNVTIYRITRPYSLPTAVANVVAIVDDILRFPAISDPVLSFGAEPKESIAMSNYEQAFASCGTSCYGYITPAVISQAHQMSPAVTAAPGNGIVVGEFQRLYSAPDTLNTLATACGRGPLDNINVAGTYGMAECDEVIIVCERILNIYYIYACMK